MRVLLLLIAPNTVLVRGKRSMFKVQTLSCSDSEPVLPATGYNDDRSFIVLTETKFSFRCIPVWDRYSPHRTRVEKKKNTCDNALTMTSPVHW